MAYKITDDCICCGACEAECKNKAISEGDDIYVIATDRCTVWVGNHGAPKCAEICPVDACVPDPDHEESKEQLLDKWRGLHPGKTPVFES